SSNLVSRSTHAPTSKDVGAFSLLTRERAALADLEGGPLSLGDKPVLWPSIAALSLLTAPSRRA
ncbi:hypothetical protein, partial [Deinococcus daejeonensis]|uniref:hypothetical protein n=1 Tax=Deinococcus daejeonensis TaxID=1007098 RepID=UPI001E4B8867